MTPTQFPAELHSELALAIHAYALSAGPRETSRLSEATTAVCHAAHDMNMRPEQMVLALRRAYDSLTAANDLDHYRLGAAYDKLLSACLAAYFEEAQRRKSGA